VDVLRVIEVFDALLEHGADLDTILRRTALLAGCSAGVRTADGTIDKAVDPQGVETGEPRGPGALTRSLVSGDEVWLGRPKGGAPLDELLLQRFAITCVAALRELRSSLPKFGDPALVELAVSETAGDAERSRALSLLGYTPSASLRVLAAAGPERDVHRVVERLGGAAGRVYVVGFGRVHVVTMPREIPEELTIPVGTRIAVGPALAGLEAPRSWREARAALRFAVPSAHDSAPYSLEEAAIVDVGRLGCFNLLARYVTSDAIAEAAEVDVLDTLAAAPGGAEMLRTLEAVAATESLRRAAAILHIHHNSVRHRVTRAERMLDFDVTAPYGRVRLMLALVLRRLRDSEPGF
jgi:hypothetical protein